MCMHRKRETRIIEKIKLGYLQHALFNSCQAYTTVYYNTIHVGYYFEVSNIYTVHFHFMQATSLTFGKENEFIVQWTI